MFVRAIEMLTAGIESSAAVDGGGFSLDSSLRNSRSNESFRAVSSTRFSARTYGRLRACTDRQIHRDRQTDRHRETDKQSDSKTIRQRERQTDTERQTESKTDGYRHRESDRQIQRDMHIDTWTD